MIGQFEQESFLGRFVKEADTTGCGECDQIDTATLDYAKASIKLVENALERLLLGETQIAIDLLSEALREPDRDISLRFWAYKKIEGVRRANIAREASFLASITPEFVLCALANGASL